jgi:transposase
MQETAHDVAKIQVGRAMLQGCSWREAVQAAGVQMSRATAYRLRQRMLAHGEDALGERRQGHPTKVRGAVRIWLVGYYQQHPHAPGKAVQALLEGQCGMRVSVTHLNRVRAALTGATHRGKNQPGAWQDGAGGFLLLAAAQETSLLPTLEAASPSRRRCPRSADWRGPAPERDGSLC